MGKIHDALQRAEELRRSAPVDGDARPAIAPEITPTAAAPAAPPAPGWLERRRNAKEAARAARAAKAAQSVRTIVRGRATPFVSGSESPISEEYRTLRARIQSLRRTRELRSIVISSALPNEGKTTTAANLALCFGFERELTTCLVDADLRTPRVHQVFPLTGPAGLVEVLEGDAKLDEALVPVPDTRLMVLPVRALPTAPSELLGSRAMADLIAELHTRFHTVILDAPPVLGLPDTVTLVDLCDAALFVVGAGRAPREEVEAALERLDASKVLGVVLNRCERHELSYAGYGYGYGKNG
jgi:capsular exopolysaccharide synthesis family protein